MIVIPYAGTLSLARRPYATLGVMLICLLVHLVAVQREATITEEIGRYCDRVGHSLHAEANRIDADDVEPCRFFLEERHGFTSQGAFRRYLHAALEDEGSFDRNQINDLGAEIERHYNRVGATLPSYLQVRLAHDPESFNPLRMLTSSLAHVDWWHLIGNLVFFFAFATMVEAILGPALFLLWLAALSLTSGVAYNLFCLFAPECVPTLGLSGEVMGVMGTAAFLAPRARVNTVLFSGMIGWRLAIPAWVLTAFFVAGDMLDLFGGGMQDSSVNFLSHVTGGLAGFLGACAFLGTIKRRHQDAIDDAVELAAIERGNGRGSLERERLTRRQLDNERRQLQAESDRRAFSTELYRCVRADNSARTQLLLLESYDIWKRNPEIYEELFHEIGTYRRGRSWLCAGRLCIHLYILTGRYSRAIAIAEQLAAVFPQLELASPEDALQLAHEASSLGKMDLVKLFLGGRITMQRSTERYPTL
ncbi:MAG: rhomboid family intramembrane serine protease, partial [Caldilineaceae bacterium]|nr:rhomboid family intramembrane serine protease [Caldilineaceae bacterium]